MNKKLIVIIFFITSLISEAQEKQYCLKFSKEDKNSLVIKEGKKISFMLLNEEIWNKGEITKITEDSLFIEKYVSSGMFADGDNYSVIGYNINDFKTIGYKKTTNVIGGTAKSIVIVTSAILTFGTAIQGLSPDDAEDMFDKNIDVEEGWKLEIILCN
ncbi:MAG: hypothetical protein KJZ55_06095 [Flavobacteriales bacterium]|nr:hypothetical protein [Flavobacteriales bacterium]